MIIEYIRYHIDPADADQFEAAYLAASEPLAASPHCIDYELSRCHEEPERYTLRIRWDSLEGHIDGFRRSSEFRQFFAHIRPYVDMIEEMQHYTPTRVTGPASEASEAID